MTAKPTPTPPSLVERINDWVTENYPDDNIIVFDGLDSAFIGAATRINHPPVAVYDYDLIVAALLRSGIETYEEAVEYIDFNVTGAYVGEQTPIVLNRADWIKVR